MFGLEQITWNTFFFFLLLALLGYYLAVMIHAFLKSGQSPKEQFFEKEAEAGPKNQPFRTMEVKAEDYPAEQITLNLQDQGALLIDLAAGDHPDSGYQLENLSQDTLSDREAFLKNVQHKRLSSSH